MSNKRIHTLATASFFLAIISILSRTVGFLREILYANNFGVSDSYDLFLSCTAIPLVINTSLLYLIQHYFISSYNSFTSEESKKEFFHYTFWWFLIIGILIALTMLIAAPLIKLFYLKNLNEEFQNTGMVIYYIFIFTIPLSIGISLVSAYMQAEFKFIYPAIIQITMNVVIVITIFFFSHIGGIYILPISFVIGHFAGFIMIIKPIYRNLKFELKPLFSFDRRSLHLNNVLFLIVIEFLSLSYIIVDRYFIGRIPPGGLAALNYSIVIFNLPISTFTITFITVLFSKFSRSASENKSEIKSNYFKAQGINICIMTLLSFLFYFWGDLFLRLFYERGEFNASATLITFSTLKFYTLGLIFFSSYILIVKLYYSLNLFKIIMFLSIAGVSIKIVLNFLLVDTLFQDGLALATSFVYIALFVLSLLIITYKYLKSYSPIMKIFLLYFFNALISFSLVKLFKIFPQNLMLIEPVLFSLIFMTNLFFLKTEEYYLFFRLFQSIYIRRTKLR